MITKVQIFIRTLEVPHREWPLLELERHETVEILIDLILGELMVWHIPFFQDVRDLTDLHMELSPHLRVILDECTLDSLLRDNDISLNFRIRPTLEVPEIGLHEISHILSSLMMVELLAEDVLFLERITLAQSLDNIVQYIGKFHVLLCIRTVLLHRILYTYDDGTVTLIREENGIQQVPVVILDVLQLSKQPVERFLLPNHIS